MLLRVVVKARRLTPDALDGGMSRRLEAMRPPIEIFNHQGHEGHKGKSFNNE
jgi:hypothetical protein